MIKFILLILELIIAYFSWDYAKLYTEEYHRSEWKPYNIRVKYAKEANKFILISVVVMIIIVLTLVYL